jgi:hypothetical protein
MSVNLQSKISLHMFLGVLGTNYGNSQQSLSQDICCNLSSCLLWPQNGHRIGVDWESDGWHCNPGLVED